MDYCEKCEKLANDFYKYKTPRSGFLYIVERLSHIEGIEVENNSKGRINVLFPSKLVMRIVEWDGIGVVLVFNHIQIHPTRQQSLFVDYSTYHSNFVSKVYELIKD